MNVENRSEQILDKRSVLIAVSVFEEPELISDLLVKDDFHVKIANDGAEALREFIDGGFEAIIVAPDLPTIDGFCVLEEIRMRSSRPSLLLAACEKDYLKGLEAGADDFLLKPFRHTELLTRLRMILGRPAKDTSDSVLLRSGDLCLNVKTHDAWVGENRFDVTAVEFAILRSLVRARGRIVSRDELAAVLYQRSATPFERSLDVHISNLRKKIQPIGRDAIRTIRGVGYLFASPSFDVAAGPEGCPGDKR